MRISIIGPTGGGKSTLARQISERFSVPHIQIDRFWFESGGALDQTDNERERVAEEILSRIRPFLQKPDWVCDGTYNRIQPEIADLADEVVLIETSFLERIRNHFVRMHDRTHRHPEVSYGMDILYFAEIVKRQLAGRQKIQALADAYATKLVHLRNRTEIKTYFNELESRSFV